MFQIAMVLAGIGLHSQKLRNFLHLCQTVRMANNNIHRMSAYTCTGFSFWNKGLCLESWYSFHASVSWSYLPDWKPATMQHCFQNVSECIDLVSTRFYVNKICSAYAMVLDADCTEEIQSTPGGTLARLPRVSTSSVRWQFVFKIYWPSSAEILFQNSSSAASQHCSVRMHDHRFREIARNVEARSRVALKNAIYRKTQEYI